MQKPSIPKGTRDFSPAEMMRRNYIFDSIRQVFRVSGVGSIAGCYVTDGSIVRGSNVRLLRDNVVIFEGKLASLKRFKDDVREVNEGYECGMSIEKFNDIKEGDVIEAYIMEELQQ